MYAAIALIVLASVVSCTDFIGGKECCFYRCLGPIGHVTSVELSGCPDGRDPCILRYGGTANLTINFSTTPYYDLDDITAKGILRYTDYDDDPVGDGYDRDACVGHNLDCPLQREKSYSYKTFIQFDDHYPQPHYKMIWYLNYYSEPAGYTFAVACAKISVRFYSASFEFPSN